MHANRSRCSSRPRRAWPPWWHKSAENGDKRPRLHMPRSKGKMHQRPRRRGDRDREVSVCSSTSQLGAGWTLTACCLLGSCLSVVPDLCAAFGTGGTASTPARRRFSTNRLLPDLSDSPALNGHGVGAAGTTSLGAATTATFEDVAALSQDVPESDAVDDADETTKVGVLMLNLGGPETGEDVEGMFTGNCFVVLWLSILMHVATVVSASHLILTTTGFPS